MEKNMKKKRKFQLRGPTKELPGKAFQELHMRQQRLPGQQTGLAKSCSARLWQRELQGQGTSTRLLQTSWSKDRAAGWCRAFVMTRLMTGIFKSG